jgi:hypothetical protein
VISRLVYLSTCIFSWYRITSHQHDIHSPIS